MKKIIIGILALVLATSPALSEKKKEIKKEEPVLTMPEKECRYLTMHQPSADTEYKPGVDVHGKPVMEADVTTSVIQPPEKYSFDISVDVAKHMGLTVPEGVLGEAKMGTVTVEKGQVKFNGNLLEGNAEAALKALCIQKTPK